MQAPGIRVSSEGVVITPEGMGQIEQRHEGKQKMLADMRADREAAYALKDSHIGVQIARDLGELSLIAPTYHNLAAMANHCALAGKHDAGRTLASLANGLMRGAVSLFGPTIEQRIYDYEVTLTEHAKQDLGLSPKPADHGDGFGEDGTEYVAAQAESAPLLAGVTSQQLGDIDDAIAEQLRNFAMSPPDTDDQGSGEREPLGVTEVAAVSPEPDEESPQRKAARLRREAKRIAEQGQGAAKDT
jgi:hypothetical protein